MGKNSVAVLILLATMLSIAGAGCLEKIWSGNSGSALEPMPSGAAAAPSLQPTADVPADLLEDQLDKSLEELEVVG